MHKNAHHIRWFELVTFILLFFSSLMHLRCGEWMCKNKYFLLLHYGNFDLNIVFEIIFTFMLFSTNIITRLVWSKNVKNVHIFDELVHIHIRYYFCTRIFSKSPLSLFRLLPLRKKLSTSLFAVIYGMRNCIKNSAH